MGETVIQVEEEEKLCGWSIRITEKTTKILFHSKSRRKYAPPIND
jgi:hypothetical protein